MDPLNFYTPMVGRFVSGDVDVKRTRDGDGRPIAEDDQRYEFGVAFPKVEFMQWMGQTVWPYLTQAYGNNTDAMQRITEWFQNPAVKGRFSMKMTDGDAPNSKGKVNDNTKGHIVMWFSSLGVSTVDPANNEIDPSAIKRGFYVQVAGNLKPNNQAGDRVGIYLNGNVVRLRARGQEIMGGVDAETAFGGTKGDDFALPPGAIPITSDPSAQAMPSAVPGMPSAAPAMPVGNPTAPDPTATVGAPTQAQNSAQPQTAYGSAPPDYGILNGAG